MNLRYSFECKVTGAATNIAAAIGKGFTIGAWDNAQKWIASHREDKELL